MAKNFIDDVASFILKTREIPTTDSWAETVAGQILTTCVLRSLYTPTKWTPIHGIKFTSADINCSPSSVYFKGMPVDHVAMPIITKFTRLLAEDEKNPRYVDLIMPPIMTSPEAMTDFIFENEFCIDWKEEITTLFKASSEKRQTYEPRIEFYTKLLDGTPLKRRIRKRKAKEGEDPEQYIWLIEDYRYNLIGATTSYLFDVMDKYIFTQGLAPRICWEWNEGMNPKKPPKDMFDRAYEPEAEIKKIEEYADFLVEVNKWVRKKDPPFILVGFMSNDIVYDFMMDMRKVVGEDTLNPLDADMIRSIQGRQWIHAVKSAQKRFIGELWDWWKRHNELNAVPHDIFITQEHIKWGIEKARLHLKSARTMLEKWDERIEQRELARKQSKSALRDIRRLQKISSVLEAQGMRGATERMLTHSIGTSCKEFVKRLERLGHAYSTKEKYNPNDRKKSTVWRLTKYSKVSVSVARASRGYS